MRSHARCLFAAAPLVLGCLWSAPALAVCVPAPAPGFLCPMDVPGKEYSTRFDTNMFGAALPLQTLHWIGGDPGPSVVIDGLNYLPARVPGNEVDAMAHTNDHLFTGTSGYVSDDKFHLLFNVGNEADIRWETPLAPISGLWGSPPTPITDAGTRLGVDALEVWGADAPGLDANRFSLLGDPFGVAVWSAAGVPIIFTAEIGGAIGLSQSLWNQLDVDALMIGDADSKILFSIAPVGPFDGGEIWVLDRVTGAAPFLRHGGHLWDTAFSPMATYGLMSENVTVLEAIDVSAVPEPQTTALWLAGLGLLAGAARRRGSQR